MRNFGGNLAHPAQNPRDLSTRPNLTVGTVGGEREAKTLRGVGVDTSKRTQHPTMLGRWAARHRHLTYPLVAFAAFIGGRASTDPIPDARTFFYDKLVTPILDPNTANPDSKEMEIKQSSLYVYPSELSGIDLTKENIAKAILPTVFFGDLKNIKNDQILFTVLCINRPFTRLKGSKVIPERAEDHEQRITYHVTVNDFLSGNFDSMRNRINLDLLPQSGSWMEKMIDGELVKYNECPDGDIISVTTRPGLVPMSLKYLNNNINQKHEDTTKDKFIKKLKQTNLLPRSL